MADPRVIREAPVVLVGVHGGDWFGRAAGRAVGSATVLVGAPRHLDSVPPTAARRVTLGGDLPALLHQIGAWRADGERVCLLASGDPGFFGLARLARASLGADAVEVHPAPSSVSLAFARVATSWDDAEVVSAHGRHPGHAVEAVVRHPKVAVLCSPDTPPEALGRSLLDVARGQRRVVVASRLGDDAEQVWEGDVASLAGGRFDPLSVVLFLAPGPDDAVTGPGISWGRPEAAYTHRAGLITKAEVRAVALGKLALPRAGVMWDLGAGSGSVCAECTALAPGLAVYAVERAADQLACLRQNVDGTAVTVVDGDAPGVLAALPDPDRVFVGGGGMEVLDAALARLRPGGTVVATFASPERASAAASRLGSMVQVSVNRWAALGPAGSHRLAAENPVFVCWGPDPQ